MSVDESVTTRLLRDVAPKVAGIVRALLGASHPDVDDAIQQSLIAFVHALPSFRGDCAPLGYARVITVRTVLAMRRRGRTLSAREDHEADLERLPEGHAPSPAESTAKGERQRLLHGLLDELAPEQAETLALRIVLGLSLEEVASHTGAPLNTVRSRLRIAKERLKARIEGDPSLYDALVAA